MSVAHCFASTTVLSPNSCRDEAGGVALSNSLLSFVQPANKAVKALSMQNLDKQLAIQGTYCTGMLQIRPPHRMRRSVIDSLQHCAGGRPRIGQEGFRSAAVNSANNLSSHPYHQNLQLDDIVVAIPTHMTNAVLFAAGRAARQVRIRNSVKQFSLVDAIYHDT